MLSIAEELIQVRDNYSEKNTIKKFLYLNATSLLPWHVVLTSLLCVTVLFVHSIMQLSYSDLSLSVAILILCVVGCNLYLVYWNRVRKRREVVQRISRLSDIIKDSCKNKSQENINKDFFAYIRHCESTSFFTGPSHNFSLVYLEQNDEPVPYPTSLVSSGSAIALCSGQPSPCQAICSLDKCVSLAKGEVFSKDDLSQIHNREESGCHLYKFDVIRSPIVEEIEVCLNNFNGSTSGRLFNRPKSVLTKKREEMFHYILKVLIPALCIFTVIVSFIWYFLPCYHSVAKRSTNSSFSSSLFVERNNDKYWFELFITAPALSALPLVPILCPLLWISLYLLGEAKTLAPIFEIKKDSDAEQKGFVSPAPTPTTHSLDELLSENSSTQQVHPTTWVQLLPKVLSGDEILFSQNAGMFDILGSLTALCCIDKEGVLSWYDPAPEKVCFFTQMTEKKTKQDTEEGLATEDSNDSITASDSSGASPTSAKKTLAANPSDDHMEIITLSQDSQRSNKLHFDDPDWMRFLPSLKAIGLNILATNFVESAEEATPLSPRQQDCPHGYAVSIMDSLKEVFKSQRETERRKLYQEVLLQHQNELKFCAYELGCSMPEISSLKTGLRGLAELTGFESNVPLLYMPKAVLTMYKKNSFLKRSISKRFQRPTPPHVADALDASPSLEYQHGIVTCHWPNEKQDYLLASGSGDLVVQGCTHFWDGVDVKLMDDTNRRKVRDFCHRHAITGSCIAFSFRPVGSRFREKGNLMKHAAEDSDNEFPADQIFLGAVAMQYQARRNVFRLIEDLDHASIRFVYFSSEDEFKARVFAEKMGLEVGWNCHISLSSREQHLEDASSRSLHNSDSDGQEDDDPSISLLNQHFPQTPISESSFSDSAFHALNRAKLPRGIENIIPHIENIDNVPLLVPLFTDCKKNSTIKMIEIMQMYNEVVCCIGSSDHIDNIQVFAKADVSIGLQPLVTSHDHVTGEKESSFRESPRMDSSLHISSVPSQGSVHRSPGWKGTQANNMLMSLARNLNTFPCSVALSSGDNLAVLHKMIKRARHFLFLTHVSLVFYMKCLAMITYVQLLTHLLHLPLIFTPLDVFWLSYVIVPCLSFSILASSRDPDLMRWASLTNTSRQSTSSGLVRDNLKHFATKFSPSCVVVVGLYSLGLQSSCQTIQENFNTRLSNSSIKNNDFFNLSDHNASSSVQCYPCFIIKTNSSEFLGLKEASLAYSSQQKRVSQQLSLCAMVLYICIISSAYVHRWKKFVTKPPFSNRVWIATVCSIFFVQAIYSVINLLPGTIAHGEGFQGGLLGPLEPVIWVLFFVWPLPLFAFNEFAKYKEIRMWTRSQKRARLAFGTKLGMNSPF